MSAELNRCPECGKNLDPELIRCTSCLAFVHDLNPWQREHKLIAFPVALALTTILGVLIKQNLLPKQLDVFEDGISLTIVGIGIYALLVIYIKNRITSRQVRAFRIIRRLLAPGHNLTKETLSEARNAIGLAGLMPFNTLLAYNRLQWVIDAAAVDVQERELLLRSMHEHSETDWESLDGTFSFIQYLVWLLPSLGFLGTVWGMTRALNGFSETVNQAAGDLTFQNSLSETAQGLGIAFHTTLVGLALVIPVLLAATAARRRVQHLLEQLDRFFIRYCSQPLELNDPETEKAEAWPELPFKPVDPPVVERADDLYVQAPDHADDSLINDELTETEDTPPRSTSDETNERPSTDWLDGDMAGDTTIGDADYDK